MNSTDLEPSGSYLEILRSEYQPAQTLGEFRVKDHQGKTLFKGVTLELPWEENRRRVSCIPKGTYQAEEREDPDSQFQYPHILIKGVEGRSWILGHAGNFYSDTLGCILFGARFKDIDGDEILDITRSRETLERILELLPDHFEIRIRGAF